MSQMIVESSEIAPPETQAQSPKTPSTEPQLHFIWGCGSTRRRMRSK